jgi:nicotinamidase-related amidase
MQWKKEATMIIEPDKTALLLLHWQNDIVLSGYSKHAAIMAERLMASHTIEHAQAVLKASRDKGILVVYVNASHRPGFPELPKTRAPIFENVAANKDHIRGSKGSEVIEQLKPRDDDLIVYNYNPSSFYYTDLDLLLRNRGITHLVLSGITTNWVVETTARDGACMGYFIITLKDCCNSSTDEMHNWPLVNILPRLGAVIDSKAYIAALQGDR